ncbi:MAG: AI-2E family transporter [Candidatus Krumholzibacteriia bacterium]
MELPRPAEPGLRPHDAFPPGHAATAEPACLDRPIRRGFLFIAALVVVLMLAIYRPLAQPILWAAAFAVLVYPAHQKLLHRLGGRATPAAVFSTVLWFSVVVGPSLAAVGQLISETRELWPRLFALLGDDVFENVAHWVERSPLRRFAYLALEVPDGGGAAELQARFKSAVDAFAGFLLKQLRHLTLGAPTAAFHMVLTIVTFGFLLRQGPDLLRGFRELLPIHPARAEALLQTVSMSVNAVFRGVLLTAASQGVLAMLGFLVAGAPVPVLLGFLTMIASLIPFVGAVAVWMPTALGMYLAGRVGAAIGLALWGSLVVSLVDNLLRPYFIRRGMRLPTLWLFLALIGGLQTFGFLGLVLGPAALALYLACFRIYQQDRSSRVLDAQPAEAQPRG